MGYLIRQLLATRNLNSIEATIKRQLEESKTQAKEALLEAKDKAVKILEDAKNQERERLAILSRQEDRLNVQLKKIEQKEDALENGKQFLEKQAEQIKAIHQEADALKKKSEEIIEQVSGLSREEAKAKLLSQIEEDSKADLIAAMQKMEKNRLEELEKKARSIMTTAIQRYARSHISEITTSTVSLPSDELKGRIIGKEGRNIRALERLTGVEIIVDETPEAITLSSFDPLRREIARLALEKLIKNVVPRFKNRQSGYTRIIRLGKRVSDHAPMVIMEWVEGVSDERLPHVAQDPRQSKIGVKGSKPTSLNERRLRKSDKTSRNKPRRRSALSQVGRRSSQKRKKKENK